MYRFMIIAVLWFVQNLLQIPDVLKYFVAKDFWTIAQFKMWRCLFVHLKGTYCIYSQFSASVLALRTDISMLTLHVH